jgi:hypothetical protein
MKVRQAFQPDMKLGQAFQPDVSPERLTYVTRSKRSGTGATMNRRQFARESRLSPIVPSAAICRVLP